MDSERKEFAPMGSKFFPFRVDPFSEGDYCTGMQTGITKVISLVKMASVSFLLKKIVMALQSSISKQSDRLTEVKGHGCTYKGNNSDLEMFTSLLVLGCLLRK